PALVGHAIDRLAALVLCHGRALFVGRLLEPVREAVAAKAREVHQVDVLHIGALAQVRDKAPESGGFEFRSGLVGDRHGSLCRRCRAMLLMWALPRILPYHSANKGL